jgi:hypothetical protein
VDGDEVGDGRTIDFGRAIVLGDEEVGGGDSRANGFLRRDPLMVAIASTAYFQFPQGLKQCSNLLTAKTSQSAKIQSARKKRSHRD